MSGVFLSRRLLGQARVVTIWENNRSRQKLTFETHDFLVDFHKDNWRYNSFAKAAWNSKDPPYPSNLYPLKYKRDLNPLIEFGLQGGGKLVVPCLEFFSRCYGRSQELTRMLATYPWRGPNNPYSHSLYHLGTDVRIAHRVRCHWHHYKNRIYVCSRTCRSSYLVLATGEDSIYDQSQENKAELR